MVCKHLNFDDMCQPVIQYNDNDEKDKYFPTTPLDDMVWSEEPIPERDLCINMDPGNSQASYPSRQMSIHRDPFTRQPPKLNWMDSMFSDMPNIIDITEEVPIQEYLLESWV